MAFLDLTGCKFGRLTVSALDPQSKRTDLHWICVCECGNICSVPRGNLRRGKTKSCGCFSKEIRSTPRQGPHVSDSQCSVDGCTAPVRCTNLCEIHYSRYKRHGDPNIMLIAPFGSGRLQDGYRRIGINGKYKLEHIVIVEKALGRELRGTEEVHHFNEIRDDNRNDNLVVCPDRTYHKLLHHRQHALRDCGDASKRRCVICHKYDSVDNLIRSGFCLVHHQCRKDSINKAHQIRRNRDRK
jgi:hypothetical protein